MPINGRLLYLRPGHCPLVSLLDTLAEISFESFEERNIRCLKAMGLHRVLDSIRLKPGPVIGIRCNILECLKHLRV